MSIDMVEMNIVEPDTRNENSQSPATIETDEAPAASPTVLQNGPNNRKNHMQSNSPAIAMATNGGKSSTTPTTASTKRSRKASGDVDLKGKIIEFMRDRPFLWNNKHPRYKDNRERENEFNLFSQSINHPAVDIKRIWHVLRTNFFRAHKLMLERPQPVTNGCGGPESGDKLWKYYRAMEFILEGTQYDHNTTNNNCGSNDTSGRSSLCDGSSSNNTTSSSNSDDNTCNSTPRQTRSSKMLKASNNLAITPMSAPVTPSSNTITTRANSSRNLKSQPTNIDDTTADAAAAAAAVAATTPTIETDDDHLYARYLTSTLKRFDPLTKEVLKLKFQEIVVEFMQKQQQQHQHQKPKSQTKQEEQKLQMQVQPP